jgi:hypothetical protein
MEEVDEYLWEVYQRTAVKSDSSGDSECLHTYVLINSAPLPLRTLPDISRSSHLVPEALWRI